MLDNDKQWQWTFTNAPPNFTNWNIGEPNGGTNEWCAEMYGGWLTGLWNDAPCDQRNQYICEKEEDKRKNSSVKNPSGKSNLKETTMKRLKINLKDLQEAKI